MRESYFPMVVFPSVEHNGMTVFKTPVSDIEVNAPKQLIQKLTKICDGTKSYDLVVNELGKSWDDKTIDDILCAMRNAGVIADSRSLSAHIWSFVSNPNTYYRDLSNEEINILIETSQKRICATSGTSIKVSDFDLKNTIKRRRSTRRFSNKRMSESELGVLLWASYGNIFDGGSNTAFVRKPVPSAGGLYPLHISLTLFGKSDTLDAGTYDVYFGKDDIVNLEKTSTHITEIYAAFIDYDVLRTANGVITISGAFAIHEEKYCNRAVLYTPIEAGHAAQNVHLAAVELGVGTVEIGGFKEKELADALRLNESLMPLTTIVFGYPELASDVNNLKSSGIEARWVKSISDRYCLPFSMVFARISGTGSRDWACGRDVEPSVAYQKAVSEAHEWHASGWMHGDLIRAKYNELHQAIHPHEIVKYSSQQYRLKHFPFVEFESDREYCWTTVQNIITDEFHSLLADCVYFPYQADSYYTFANSSGTAASNDFENAIRTAVLELIERDAFMIVWLQRLKMPKFDVKSMPLDIQQRVRILEELRYDVHILNFTLDTAPVIFVLAQSSELLHTTCSASSGFDVEDVVDHALKEIESSIYCKLEFPQSNFIKPKDVRHTSDHGVLYEQERYFREADFLVSDCPCMKFNDVSGAPNKNWESLVDTLHKKHLRILALELTSTDKAINSPNLRIAKAFIPGLVPISFGYRQEPGGMRRLYDVPIKLGLTDRKMPYGTLTKFPHPFT